MADKMVVGVSQARQNFFELIALAQQGREILVEKRGKPVVVINMAVKRNKHEEKERALAIKNLSKLDLKIDMGWEEMEKIISDAHTPHF